MAAETGIKAPRQQNPPAPGGVGERAPQTFLQTPPILRCPPKCTQEGGFGVDPNFGLPPGFVFRARGAKAGPREANKQKKKGWGGREGGAASSHLTHAQLPKFVGRRTPAARNPKNTEGYGVMRRAGLRGELPSGFFCQGESRKEMLRAQKPTSARPRSLWKWEKGEERFRESCWL